MRTVALVLVAILGCRDAVAPEPSAAPAVITMAQPPPAPAAGSAAPAPSPRQLAFRASYTKYEYRIPMRDGVRLFTAVYVPNDAGPKKKYPFLIERTPYSIAPYGSDRYGTVAPEPFERDGFIFVMQDVRGKNMSEGTFEQVRPIAASKGPRDIDESTDAFDTIAWLLKSIPNHNGKAAQYGVSYPGFYTSAAIIDGHPALVAASPQAPVGDWWIGDDVHRNGALVLHQSFAFIGRVDRPRHVPSSEDEVWPALDFGTPDAYQYFLDAPPISSFGPAQFKAEVPFWKDVVSHPDYDDFWKARNIIPKLRNVRASVLVVGGWYDTEDLYGTLETYRAIEAQNPGVKNTLIMGPWTHGGWYGPGSKVGDQDNGFATGASFHDLQLAYFKHLLKGGPDPDFPEALVFETGANRWRRFDAWPPRTAREATFYLRADQLLAREAATSDERPDEFLSDPWKPVPYTADPQTIYWSTDYMAEDQRFAARRPDVLVYATPPLERDVTIAGPIDVELHVSTTGTDADWVVKLVDASPGKLSGWTRRDLEDAKPDKGAKQVLVRGEPFRGRYRESLEKSIPFVPNEVTKIAYRLDDVFHTFKRGHRIMIHVQSSWFPFVDRNPQKFLPNVYDAKHADFVKATHRVHHTAATASKITVKLVPAADEE